MMQSALAIILVLGVLIAFHELGHFLVARLLGIGVKTFSIGFGPKLLAFKKGQTDYALSLIPLGGYVALVGEQPGQDLPEGFTERQSFLKRPALQRMLVVAAGPIFNIFLAWVIYFGLAWSDGTLTHSLAIIGQVEQDSPAQTAGLERCDQVLAIDGVEINEWDDLSNIVKDSEGKDLRFTILRDRQTMDLTITPEQRVSTNIFMQEVKRPRIGIGSSGDYAVESIGFGGAALAGLEHTWFYIKVTGQFFGKLISGQISMDNVGGPVIIAKLVSKQAKKGIAYLLLLTALISVNLGVLNLLPIPVLDGGHILFFGLEAIFRRPVNRKVQEVTTKAGLFFLLGFMAFTIINDIGRDIPEPPVQTEVIEPCLSEPPVYNPGR